MIYLVEANGKQVEIDAQNIFEVQEKFTLYLKKIGKFGKWRYKIRPKNPAPIVKLDINEVLKQEEEERKQRRLDKKLRRYSWDLESWEDFEQLFQEK